MWLALDASTYTGSAAVGRGGQVHAARAVTTRDTVAEHLMPAVVSLVEEAGGWAAVDLIVVGGGPGSFTSLRIAASLAKGIAMGRRIPMASCRSLALAVAVLAPGPGRYVAVLDALRGEVFAGEFEVGVDGDLRAVGGDERWPAGEAAERATVRGASLIGWPGDLANFVPLAAGVARVIGGDLVQEVSLERWEPSYGRLAEAQVQWERAHGQALAP